MNHAWLAIIATGSIPVLFLPDHEEIGVVLLTKFIEEVVVTNPCERDKVISLLETLQVSWDYKAGVTITVLHNPVPVKSSKGWFALTSHILT